jgi:uncharacterized repeat protein (TIGR03803 family)
MCIERIVSRGVGSWIVRAAVILAGFLVFAGVGAQAQTFTVLHQFSGPDGAAPVAGLTMDRAGNLYGTALIGGQGFQYCNLGCGTVFKLTHSGSGWVFTPIYRFSGQDGANPQARVVFGPDGALYGTATQGGANGRGVVFQLRPSATFCKAIQCPWTETILHNFARSNDGSYPGSGDLLFDSAGNIWGTTGDGGDSFSGTVYQLVRSNGSWTENVIHSFGAPGDGSRPAAGLIMDSQGNLYGTTQNGGSTQGGTVYQLTPSGAGWTETVIHSFDNATEGSIPLGGVIFDAAGNLYGTTSAGGLSFSGGVYELTPTGNGWVSNLLYFFTNAYVGSRASLTFGANGKLYGTLDLADVDVFELTQSGGTWTQTGIYGRTNDVPEGNVIFDANGNLYTTGSQGGPNQDGLVLQITP